DPGWNGGRLRRRGHHHEDARALDAGLRRGTTSRGASSGQARGVLPAGAHGGAFTSVLDGEPGAVTSSKNEQPPSPLMLAAEQLERDRVSTRRFPQLFARKMARMTMSPLAYLRGA